MSSLFYRLRWSLLKRIGYSSIVANRDTYRLDLEFSNVSSRLMYFGNYEKDEQHVLNTHVHEGMCVLDVGANLGYFTLLMATLVGKSGRVYGFEPNPRMNKILRSNAALNPHMNDGRLCIQPEALGSQKERLKFYCPIEGHEGVGGLQDTQRAKLSHFIEVDVIPLDAFVVREKIERLDFIKLDIEGGELGFLQGGQSVLKKFKPTILYEACEKNSVAYGYKPEALHSYLRNFGYEISQVGADENFLATPSQKVAT